MKEQTPFYKYKKDNLVTGNSLLDINAIKKNIYIGTNGSQINYNGWDATDYIDIESHKALIIKNHSDKYNAFYDSNKVSLSHIEFSNSYIYNDVLGKVGTNLVYIEKMSNSKYIRLSQAASALKNIAIFPVLNDDYDKYLNFTIKY